MQLIKTLAGPLTGGICWLLLHQNGVDETAAATAFVLTWMAVWWITEAISIYFTSLLPVMLFPTLGIMSMKELAPQYMGQITFLFVGGFFLAYATEKWSLHHRIANFILSNVAGSGTKLLFGLMLSSYLLSMWILNTATTTMLLPAVLAILISGKDTNPSNDAATALLLGLAYASSIGGMTTVIGTLPNLILMDYFNENYLLLEPVTFGSWLSISGPLSLALFCLTFFYLKKRFSRGLSDERLLKLEKQRKQSRPWSFEELAVASVFGLCIIAWVSMKDLNLGFIEIRGWTSYFSNPDFIKESTVAMIAAGALFIIPSRSEKGRAIITWKEARKLPIGVIFLFGGGFALAKAISSSGLSDLIALHLSGLRGLSPYFILFLLCLFMNFFTEMSSNTASTILLLPVIAVVAEVIDCHPLLLMFPVTISASCAFMLPVATPPNTIVFGSERLRIKDMISTGFWLNLISVSMILAYFKILELLGVQF